MKQMELSCRPARAIRIHVMLSNLRTPDLPFSVLIVLLAVETGYVLLSWNRKIHQLEDTGKEAVVT